jgi:predicted N-acetyltransferase YhbS
MPSTQELNKHNPGIEIRNASPVDLPAIVEVALAAFTTFTVFGPPWYDDAGILPATLCAAGGGSGLSRVALDRATGSIVGHAQWNRGRMWLAGRWRAAAWLAPLSVHAAWQSRGVGSALMRDGIVRLREDGSEILIILGHEKYYPRFGLLTGCHGRHGLSIPLPKGSAEVPDGWRLRPFAVGDEAACRELWLRLVGGTDGAIDPGPGLIPWMSNTKGIVSCMLERDGVVAGHARFDLRHGSAPEAGVLRFLADGPEAAAVLAARIVGWTGWCGERLWLPLPAGSAAVRAIVGSDARSELQRWDAGMAMALQEPDQVGQIGGLFRRIQAGEASPLYLEWSPQFDF